MTPAKQTYVCRSGSAADTQNLLAYVQWFLQQHRMELEMDLSVRTAATLARNMCYQNKVIAKPNSMCKLQQDIS